MAEGGDKPFVGIHQQAIYLLHSDEVPYDCSYLLVQYQQSSIKFEGHAAVACMNSVSTVRGQEGAYPMQIFLFADRTLNLVMTKESVPIA
jgi:hypothetical protein